MDYFSKRASLSRGHKFINSRGDTHFAYNTTLLNRGFTGHEHFFGVSLIHMNGRMYDANLGRFLSPDNFVQNPYNSQNFNRYGYVLNNPLSYVDESGEFIFLAVAIVAGAYIGGSQANGTFNPLKWDFNSIDTWGGMIGGAVVGGLSFGIGTAVGGATAGLLAANGINGGLIGGAITGLTSGVVAGGFSGGFMSILPGGDRDFAGGMLNGAWMGGLTGFGVGAAVGYFSTPKGFNRLNGNHLPQETLEASTAGVKPVTTPDKGIDNLIPRGYETKDVSNHLSLADYGQECTFVRGMDGELRMVGKQSAKMFGKTVQQTTTRMGRDGKAVEIIFKDGSKIDINVARVKQWVPNTHPKAPPGTLQKVKFPNSLPETKGYKRLPTQQELDILNGF